MKTLLVDMNNMMHRVYHMEAKSADFEDVAAMCIAGALMSLQYHVNSHDVGSVVACFDGHKNWRKVYTASDLAVTHKKYKGHRREKLTPKEKKWLEEMERSIHVLREFLDTTKVYTAHHDILEADDIVAGFVQAFPDREFVILSTDKDYMQLKSERVEIFNPVKKQHITLDEYDNNPELFLFEKCFRGEGKSGDNVQNAYPRLLKKKMFAAYTDPYEFSNLMAHEFVVECLDDAGELVQYEYTTGKLFRENIMLMGLASQPLYVRKLIYKTIKESIERADGNSPSLTKLLRFAGDNELMFMTEEIHRYKELFYVVNQPLSVSEMVVEDEFEQPTVPFIQLLQS